MTKKRLRILSVALLVLMITITLYFCLTSIPKDKASADIEYILSDVQYNTMNVGKERQIHISYFNGDRGVPTVGTYFAYGLGSSSIKSNPLPTTYTDFSGIKEVMYKSKVLFLSSTEEYYMFMVSFDFLGSDHLEYVTIYDKKYLELGYLNVRTGPSPEGLILSIYMLKDEAGNYYLADYISGRLSIINNFSGMEGEFINLTVAIPSNLVESVDFYFVSRIIFARNYYGSFGLNNKPLSNQSYMDAYAFQSLLHNLYDIDNLFWGFDEQFSETLNIAIKDSYDKGYNLGYSNGYSEGTLLTDNVTSFTWMQSIFSSATSFFNIKLFGNVTLATIIFIPLILGIVMFILKLVRG